MTISPEAVEKGDPQELVESMGVINHQYLFDLASILSSQDLKEADQQLAQLVSEKGLHLFYFILPERGNIATSKLHGHVVDKYELEQHFSEDLVVVYYFVKEQAWYAQAASDRWQEYFSPVTVKNMYECDLVPMANVASPGQLARFALTRFIALAKYDLPVSYYEFDNPKRDNIIGATDEQFHMGKIRAVLIFAFVVLLAGGGFFYYKLGVMKLTGSCLSFLVGWMLILLAHWAMIEAAHDIYGHSSIFMMIRTYIVISGIFHFGLYPTVVAGTSSKEFSMRAPFRSRYIKDDGNVDFEKYFKERQ